jgi:hypothetical protein
VAPFVDELTLKRSCYQHLEYAGCASISGSSGLENAILNNYPAMFCKGFLREDLERALSSWDPAWEQGRIKLLIPCLHDENRLQINATDEETLDSLAHELELNDEQKSCAKSFLLHTHRMAEGEAREYLTRTHPAMEKLFQMWYRSYLGHLTLTSVGIAIGHANVRRVTKSYGADLAIWVN